MAFLAGERLLAVVVGKRDVEALRVADGQADEVVLEAGDQAILADDQRHPLGAAALERSAVPAALELDDCVVALLGAAVLDRRERSVLVAKLLDDPVDFRVVDRLDLRPEVEVLVVAERDIRAGPGPLP